ncbi:MAG: ion transporter [Cytophagaceae bacterium]
MVNEKEPDQGTFFKNKRTEFLISLANNILYGFIIVNIVVICLETVEELDYLEYYFDIFEFASIIVFSIEYGIRVAWAYSQNRMWAYIISPLGIIDFISIMPFYLKELNTGNFRFVKVFRMSRFLKIYRHSEHVKIISEVVQSKKEYLRSVVYATGMVLFFCSCATYYFEHEKQPAEFSSIFSALWWGICTLTTVGSGIYPLTIGGKIMGSMLALVGIGLVAIPAGILSAGFVEVMEKKKVKVVHEGIIMQDITSHKFFFILDGEEGFLRYKIDHQKIDLYHTYVPDDLRQFGFGKKLVEFAIAYSKENDFKIIPTCPYVKKYFSEHPDLKDLLVS